MKRGYFNVVLSIYGRSSINNFISNQLNDNARIIFKNEKKIQKLQASGKVQYQDSRLSVSKYNISK